MTAIANRIAAIVRCADQLTHVHASVRSIKQQHGGGVEIILVADHHTPVPARAWLSRFGEEQGAALAVVDSFTAGAARNAGIRSSSAPYILCLDAGDLLSPDFADATIADLETRRSAAIVTTAVRWLGPGPAQTTSSPVRVDASALAEDTELIHNASVFRRSAWADHRGFDESLESLESYAFWLELLMKGGECAIAESACLVRAHRRAALYRQAWERDAHVRSFQAIVERHHAFFAREAPSALYAREQQISELAEKYRHSVRRRDGALREIETLKARAAELRQSLPEHEANGVDLGDLRRTAPIARDWGYERGQPIDRYYIERFLQQHAGDIRGAVLEVQEPDYTQRYGGERVSRSDVIDLDASNPRATVVSDLRSASNIASGTYDCIILTQTVHVVDDMAAVVRECERMLKPGGVLLATLPSASRVCLEYGHDGDFWRVTEAGARNLFSTAFAPSHLDVQACGNVLVNTAFLYGLACHEVNVPEFEAVDPYFPLLVTVRAHKQAAAPNIRRPASPSHEGGAVLLYHRVATPASDVHGLAIAPRTFRAHMAHLRDRYCPMPLSDLVAAAATGSVPAGAVAVTFDDGYVDNFSTASPILTEYAIPATFFVTTDGIDSDYEYWWDTLERILLSPALESSAALSLNLPDGRQTFELRTDADRVSAHTNIYQALAGSTADARDAVIAELKRWSGGAGTVQPQARRMRSHEVITLSKRQGHAIGAHTARHLMLSKQSPDVQRSEIFDSRVALEQLLDRRIAEFAYPYGAYDVTVVNTVREASFAAAVTCDERGLDADLNPFQIPRLEVTPARGGRFGEWLAERFQDRYFM